MMTIRSIRRFFFYAAAAAVALTLTTVNTSPGQTPHEFDGEEYDTIPPANQPTLARPTRLELPIDRATPRQTPKQHTGRIVDTLPANRPALARPTGRELLLQAYNQTHTATARADYDNIIALCRRALGDRVSPTATSYGRQLMSWAYNRRGELIADTEGEHKALVEFQRAVQLDPTRWRAVHNRGVSYFSLGRSELAMSDFTRTIQLQPKFSTAYFNRGELRFEKSDLRGAVSDYDTAIRLGVEDSSAYEGRGYALLQLGQHAAAVADFNMVIRFKPKDAGVHLSRGEAHAKLHRWEEAARDFNQAIALDGGHTRAYERAAWLMATCPDARFRQTKLAIEVARKAIDLAGETNHRNLNILAAAHANSGEFEKARLIQAKAIDTAPRAMTADYRQSLRSFEQERPIRQAAAAQIGRKPGRRTSIR
jgi:tetratricopeptide (TPR) repeat protein